MRLRERGLAVSSSKAINSDLMERPDIPRSTLQIMGVSRSAYQLQLKKHRCGGFAAPILNL